VTFSPLPLGEGLGEGFLRRLALAVLTVPDWLTKRDGSLKRGLSDTVVLVMVGGQPMYRLEVRPAGGTFSCAILQAVNGHRLDDDTTYPGADAALAGGLDRLRNRLGW
jgi:hypothetical protein